MSIRAGTQHSFFALTLLGRVFSHLQRMKGWTKQHFSWGFWEKITMCIVYIHSLFPGKFCNYLALQLKEICHLRAQPDLSSLTTLYFLLLET